MRQTIGLVGESIGWAETLGRTYSAGPFAGVNVRMQSAVSFKAVLFGSEWRRRQMSNVAVVVA